MAGLSEPAVHSRAREREGCLRLRDICQNDGNRGVPEILEELQA